LQNLLNQGGLPCQLPSFRALLDILFVALEAMDCGYFHKLADEGPPILPWFLARSSSFHLLKNG